LGVDGALEEFALTIAIGSLVLLGALLLLDVLHAGLLTKIEHYAETSAWTAVVAVPFLTLAYVLGAYTQGISDSVIQLFSPGAEPDELRALEAVARSSSDLLADRFEELRKAKKLLEGCYAPLLMLAAGMIAQGFKRAQLRALLMSLALLFIVLSGCIPIITGGLQDSIIQMGEIAARLATGSSLHGK
jgi:hypothetical protein